MMIFTIFLLLVVMATPEAASSNDTLHCLQCQRAYFADECDKIVACDAATEDCYMEEIITEQLTVVYSGGCRAKPVCQSGSTGLGKRQELIACARCCSGSDYCNRRLCGLQYRAYQCFFCEESNGYYNLTSHDVCKDLKMCSSNEVCSAKESFLDGNIVQTFGCERGTICKVLLLRSMQHHKICITKTSAPPTGVSYDEYCGIAQSVGRRSLSMCQICCYDQLCNSDTCTNIVARLVAMEAQGKFDINSL